MGDLDGGVRDLGGSFQQLRLVARCEPSDPGGCVRAGLSPASGATVIRDHAAAGKDPAGAGNGTKNLEFGLISESGHWVTGRVPVLIKWTFLRY